MLESPGQPTPLQGLALLRLQAEPRGSGGHLSGQYLWGWRARGSLQTEPLVLQDPHPWDFAGRSPRHRVGIQYKLFVLVFNRGEGRVT